MMRYTAKSFIADIQQLVECARDGKPHRAKAKDDPGSKAVRVVMKQLAQALASGTQEEIASLFDACETAKGIIRKSDTMRSKRMKARDKWIYEQREAGATNGDIVKKLRAIFTKRKWELISERHIVNAVKRHCDVIGETFVPGRPGRPSAR